MHALPGDGAAGDDAVVKARHELPEKHAAGTARPVGEDLAVALRQAQVHVLHGGVIAEQGGGQLFIHTRQRAKVRTENPLHLALDILAGKGRVQAARAEVAGSATLFLSPSGSSPQTAHHVSAMVFVPCFT